MHNLNQCQRKLRLEGKPYPRTCPICGPFGPCRQQENAAPPTGAMTVEEALRVLDAALDLAAPTVGGSAALACVRAELERLQKAEERERLCHAGCGVAALGYHKAGDPIHPDYDSASLRDVMRLRDSYDQLRAECEQLYGLLKEAAVKFDAYYCVGYVAAPTNLMKRIAEKLASAVQKKPTCAHTNWRPVADGRKCMDCGAVLL